MKDFDGQVLQIGDTVAFLPPSYRNLVKGSVCGFTQKMIRVEWYPNPKRDEIEYTVRASEFLTKIAASPLRVNHD